MKFPESVRYVLLVVGVLGCGSHSKHEARSHPPPAKVDHHPNEADLGTITLTPDAEARLGITMVPVERKNVERQRTIGGEVVVPIGQKIIIAAPLAGTVKIPDGAKFPAPGSRIKASQPIFLLLPLLSPERSVLTPTERVQMAEAKASLVRSRIEVAGEVQKAKAKAEAAKIKLERATRLQQDKVGSAKDVDNARAEMNVAQRTLEAAEASKTLLEKITLDADAGTLAVMPISSPMNGILWNVSTVAGQTVPAGTALFEVVDTNVVWIKVPVYVGLLDDIDTDADAAIGGIEGGLDRHPRTGRPITAPPVADLLASTVALFYEVENADGQLRPGQRVGVAVRLRGEAGSLVVPTAAVLTDLHGGNWVYVQTEPHTFRRRRVQIRHSVGSLAVLASGPELGTPVVTAGAAELFGTEFGSGK